MQFITYWELNENMPETERLRVAQKLTSEGLFPPQGVNLLRWDVTPDGWGVVILEAESAAEVHRALNLWRVAGDGFFKFTRTAPVMPVQEVIPLAQEMVSSVARS